MHSSNEFKSKSSARSLFDPSLSSTAFEDGLSRLTKVLESFFSLLDLKIGKNPFQKRGAYIKNAKNKYKIHFVLFQHFFYTFTVARKEKKQNKRTQNFFPIFTSTFRIFSNSFKFKNE